MIMAISPPESPAGTGSGFASEQPGSIAINTAPLPFFRFFAACIVVFFHFAQDVSWYPQVPEVFKAGSLMVTFFFVLSGFVLMLGYHQKPFSFRHYLIKRAVKILPLYYLAFVVSAGVLAYAGKLAPSEFFLNLFCLHSWVPDPLTMNFTSWFVSALIFCYGIFPLILFFLRRVRPDGGVMLVAGVLFWAVTQWLVMQIMNADTYDGDHYWSYHLIYYFPPFHLCSFFMGICGAYFLVTRNMKIGGGGFHSALITLFLLGAVAMLVQFEPELEKLVDHRLPFGVSFYAPVMLLLLLHVMLSQNPFLRILSWPKFMLWGEASYGVYILQGPLDKLDNYFISSYYEVGQVTHLVFFSLFLLLCSFLAMMAEKAVAQRFARQRMSRA
jgi:peptidoglycan/LPS O-acetylase OafA/YrhL